MTIAEYRIRAENDMRESRIGRTFFGCFSRRERRSPRRYSKKNERRGLKGGGES
jgi:hypothetical protein